MALTVDVEVNQRDRYWGTGGRGSVGGDGGRFAISPGKGRKKFQKIVAGKLISLLPLFTPFPLWVSFLS